MRRSYYESQKEYLSVLARIKIMGKVFLTALAGWSELTFLAKGYYAIWWLNHLPADFTGFLSHAGLFGLCLGYCIREGHYAYWGYKPRKFPYQAMFANALTLLLPERASVHITEVTPEDEAFVSTGEVVPPTKRQPQASEQRRSRTFCILFSVFSRFTISLKELISEVCRTLTFDPRPLAMLGYVGWKAKKAALADTEVCEQFFHGYTKDSLYHDRMHIKKTVQVMVEEFGEEEEVVRLLKTGKGTYNTIGLSDACYLDIPHLVTFWHEQAQKKHLGQAADPIELSDLRVLYRRVIAEYGRGLFEENLTEALSSKNAYWWDWAIPDFKEHRTAQIAFLSYCIKREEAESERMSDPYSQEECLQQTTWLCKTALSTCATFDPELQQGERFLQHYLQLCRRLLKRDEALETYEEYIQRLQCSQIDWEPNSETAYLMKQVRKS